jgi:tetratricopeptide (TPR) repeat protein
VYNNYIPFQTQEQVVKANELIGKNKNEEALKLLESSLLIYDSHVANRLIGEIYRGQQNFKKAFFYFNKVYDQFKFDPGFLNDFILISLAENDFTNANKMLQEFKLVDPKNKNLGVLDMLISK